MAKPRSGKAPVVCNICVGFVKSGCAAMTRTYNIYSGITRLPMSDNMLAYLFLIDRPFCSKFLKL